MAYDVYAAVVARADTSTCVVVVSLKPKPWKFHSASNGCYIPVIVGRRLPAVNTCQLFHGFRDVRVTAAKTVPRRSCNDVIRLGLFNARSVSEKSAAIHSSS